MEGIDIVSLIDHLGVAGFSILIVYYVYRDAVARLDKKDLAFRSLEKEVRERILEQLSKNTSAFERVLDHISK